MTRIKCTYATHFGTGGKLPEGYYICDHVGEDGYCTLDEIEVWLSCDWEWCAGCRNVSIKLARRRKEFEF